MRGENITHNRQPTKQLLAWIVIAVISLTVLLTYIQVSHMGNLRAMITGEQRKPFVLRALAPMLIRLVGQAIPAEAIHAALDQPALSPIIHQLCPDCHNYGLATLGILFLSLLAAIGGVMTLARDLGYSPIGEVVAVSSLLASLLLLFTPFAAVYDLPILALTAWCLVWIERDRYELYLLTFCLANLCKETALVLIPVYWLASDRGRLAIYRVAEQIMVYLAGRAILMGTFLYNPGVVAEFHLMDFLYSSPNLLWGFMAILALLITLAAWHWDYKHPYLRQSIAVMFPPLAALYFVFGYPGEIRVFLEVWPVVVLLLIPTNL